MTDDMKRKVIDIFSRHNNDMPQKNDEKVKIYAGYNYVRLDKDANGNKFNREHLLKYSQNCRYIVRVMREVGGEVILYNYDVPTEGLVDFLKSFEDKKLDGEIIELDKYFPEGLA